MENFFMQKKGQPPWKRAALFERRLVIFGADAVQQAALFEHLDEFGPVAE